MSVHRNARLMLIERVCWLTHEQFVDVHFRCYRARKQNRQWFVTWSWLLCCRKYNNIALGLLRWNSQWQILWSAENMCTLATFHWRCANWGTKAIRRGLPSCEQKNPDRISFVFEEQLTFDWRDYIQCHVLPCRHRIIDYSPTVAFRPAD